MAHDGEGVVLSTAQVQEGAAGLVGAAAVVLAWSSRRSQHRVVLGRAGVVPRHRDHLGATALLIHRGVLGLAGGWGRGVGGGLKVI